MTEEGGLESGLAGEWRVRAEYPNCGGKRKRKRKRERRRRIQ